MFGFGKKALPHCDPLFKKFLDPWYSPEDRQRRGWEATRPDILTDENYVGKREDELAILGAEDDRREVSQRIAAMLEACRRDWPKYLKVSGDLDERWIETFDQHYDRKQVAALIERSDPKDFSNDYLIVVCEFGAALGHVLQAKEPRLVWVYDWPYWDSRLVDPLTGSVIPPFHWAVKKLSEYGLEDGFAAKIEMCVGVLNKRGG